MLFLFSLARLHRAALFFSACIIVGIFVANWFRLLPSIGMAGLTATGLVYAGVHGRIAHKALWPVFGSLGLVFGLHLAGVFTTAPALLPEYGQDVLMQLPLLLLPLAFWLLPALPGRYLRALWLLLLGTSTLAALAATINYLLHFREINELYLHSKVMPTEPEHIRFSLLITLAIAAGSLLLEHRATPTRWRPWVVGMVAGQVMFLHLLAVRSGEMTFYALAGLAVLWLVVRCRDWQRAGKLVVLLLALPILSYVLFPTFRNKVYNTQEDVSKVSESRQGKNFSLAARVYSYQAAMAIWREHPVTGVGKPSLRGAMARQYATLYPEMEPRFYILPHNQFLYNLAAYGALGLLVFCLGLFYPAWWARRRHAPLLLAQYVSVGLSFLVEYTLETQIGLAFVVFFLLLALQGSLPSDDPDPTWRPA